MSFLAVLLFTFSSHAQDATANRERLDQLLHDLEVRSRIQTVLITQHEKVNLIESRRMFLELGREAQQQLDLKTGVLKDLGYSFNGIPHEIRAVGRELGSGVMIFYVGLEIFDWLGPIFFTAIGQPGVASVIIAIPEGAIVIPLIIAGREIGYQKKENRLYGGRKKRVELENKRHEEWLAQGISSLEADKIIGGYVIADKKHRKNPDALNYKRVKRYLKKNGYWNEGIKKLAKDAKWSKTEKSIVLLSQVEVGGYFDESSRVPDSELERWAIETYDIDQLSKIKTQFDKMPTDGVKASTVYRLWRYTFVPNWLHHMHGKKLKPFRCFVKNEISLAAAADMAGDRLWNTDDHEFLRGIIESCSE